MNSEEIAALEKDYKQDQGDMEDVGKDDSDPEEDPRGRTKAGGVIGKRARSAKKAGKKPTIEYEQEYEFEKDQKEEIKEPSRKRRNVSKASKSTASHDF